VSARVVLFGVSMFLVIFVCFVLLLVGENEQEVVVTGWLQPAVASFVCVVVRCVGFVQTNCALFVTASTNRTELAVSPSLYRERISCCC
jgi:hypothetical protein